MPSNSSCLSECYNKIGFVNDRFQWLGSCHQESVQNICTWPGSVFLCHLTRRSKGHHLILESDVDHLGVVENTADFGSPYEGLVPAGKDEGHLLLLEHLGVVEHPVDVEGWPRGGFCPQCCHLGGMEVISATKWENEAEPARKVPSHLICFLGRNLISLQDQKVVPILLF